MALQVKSLKRVIKFKKNGTDIILPDKDSSLTVQEVLQAHSSQYPELTTATVSEPIVTGNIAEYSIKTTVGTKG